MALLKQLKAIMDASFNSKYQSLHVDSILTLVSILVYQKLFYKFQAFCIFLFDEKNVHEPIRLLPPVQSLRAPINFDWLPIDEHGSTTPTCFAYLYLVLH